MKDKGQTHIEFERWLKFVERKTGKKVKQIQTDNGTEFTNAKFQGILKQHGISHRKSAPYTPTQNAFIGRRGQTLQNMAQAMLRGSKLPDHYRGEAILCANFYLNILWHSGIKDIPCTIWTGRKPNLKFLHVFGSPAWVHIPKETRKKGESCLLYTSPSPRD